MLNHVAHNQGEILALKMSLILKADAPTEFIADFEAGLSRVLFKEYERVGEAALKDAMRSYKGKATEAQAKAIDKALARNFEGFGKEVEPTVNEMIETFYNATVTEFIREHGLVIQKAGVQAGSVDIDFTLQDAEAVAATEMITVQSAGRYFPEQLQAKASEVIRKVVLESGLPIDEASKVLEQELRGVLGLDFDKVLPSQFKTNPSAYFDVVATNASVQATSVGRMIAMSDAGVQKFRIVAILDRRTSAICRSLDGKELSVETAMTTVNSFLGVKSIEDLENLMGFSKDGSTPDWAAKGAGFPPFHHGCRTTVVPIL